MVTGYELLIRLIVGSVGLYVAVTTNPLAR